MKTLLLSLLAFTAATFSIHAETKVTLSGVHLCCKGCVNGVTKAVKKAGASATCDAKAGSVVIAGDQASVKKALTGVSKAGY